MDLIKTVEETLKREHMVEKGGHIVAAVSGGADSACLLRVLKELSDPMDFSLEVLHVNHGLRGEEADRDEQFTRDLCGELMVPLTVKRADVRAAAAERKLSEEETGRQIRYEALRELAEERRRERGDGAPPCVIATAHHREDSAETILLNLIRGSGLKGLGGIRPAAGSVIRPLIRVSREEIRTWMEERGYGWCEDSTNGEEIFARNKIRARILPAAREINGEAAANIVRAGGFLAQADEYLEKQAAELTGSRCFRSGEACGIPSWALTEVPEILKIYGIRHMLCMADCPLRDVGGVHL